MASIRWLLACGLSLTCAACGAAAMRERAGNDGGHDSALGENAVTESEEAGAAEPNEPRAQAGDARAGESETRDAGTLRDSGTRPAGDGGAGRGDSGTQGGRWVSAYYVSYQRQLYPPDQIDWSGVSHMIFTRLKSDGGGRLQLDFDIGSVEGQELAREIARRAHQNGRKALLMLGGENGGPGIRDSTSEANRPRFVAALLRALLDLGYDGFDLDWEDNIDYERFIALVRDLRAAADAPADMILTAPGAAINVNLPSPIDRRVPELVALLDQYNLMTYYPLTAAAGFGWLSWHNGPLRGLKTATPVTIEESLNRHVAVGIPKSKLGMGIGFYAICYTGGVTAPNQSTENGVTIAGGDNDFPLSRLFGSSGVFAAQYRHWDAQAEVPYLTLPNPESHGCRYVSFEDEESIERKGAFVRAQGYGGTIVWTINQGWLTGGSKPTNALMQALKRGFLDP